MVLSPLAARVERDAGASGEWRRWAAAVALSSERDERLYAKAAAKTIGLLEPRGIAPIVIKGASLALGRPRDTGDIDLLIPEGSLIDAIGELEASGYAYRGFDRNAYIRRREYRDWKSLSRWSVQFEFQEPETGALVELHTAFFETARIYDGDLSALRRSMGEFIAASEVDEATGYRLLALEDRALLLALHTSLKYSPDRQSFALRSLMDLRTLAEAGLDWDRLRARCIRFGLAYNLAQLFRLYETLAVPCSPPRFVEGIESLLPRRLVRLTRMQIRCLRSLESYDTVATFAYQLISPFLLHSTPGARLRSLLVIPLLVPRRHKIASIYGLPARSPVVVLCYLLEPLRWSFRLARKAWKTIRSCDARPV